jgi:hypothetical protein
MPREKSYALVIVAALVIAVLMPFARALARGDNEVPVAAGYTVASAHVGSPPSLARNGSDELSMFVVGAFLLGLGVVLRRVA